ncbi:MAG: hypothetical protein SGI89_09215 [bacterium]|nr:hypothetical protein [bacterium]
MKKVELPEIINISEVLKKKSKNFVIHFTDAQWKKAISKAKIYKGKKEFRNLPGDFVEFHPLPQLGGGLISAFKVNKAGKVSNLFPKVELIDGKSTIVFPLRTGGRPRPRLCHLTSNGIYFHCSGDCPSSNNPSCNDVRNAEGKLIGCCCGAHTIYI